MPAINGDWLEALKDEFKKDYYKKLFDTVNQEYRTHQIFPPADDVFNAFHLTPLKDVKVALGEGDHLDEKVARLKQLEPDLLDKAGTLHMESYTDESTHISLEAVK